MECILKSSPKLGEPTLEVRAEDKLVYIMPYEEEEDRVSEVKCSKGGGVCGIGSTRGHASNSYIVTIIFKSTDFTQTVTLLHAFPLYRYGRTAHTSSIHRNVPAERSINQGRTLSFAKKAFVRFEQFVFQKIRQ